MVTIVWFRLDLRLTDNRALAAAASRGGPVVPVFILCDAEEGDWPPGAASRWWLHRSLEALDSSLRERGSRLILKHGHAGQSLLELVDETGAAAVYWNRRYEPAAIERDSLVKRMLRDRGIAAESFNSALLCEPWDAESSSGKPYRVFTPFKRALLERLDPPPPEPAPRSLPSPPRWPASSSLASLRLLPKIRWYRGMEKAWEPGEQGALAQAKRFLRKPLADYGASRELPAVSGTSRLSPHLHFGEISVRWLWFAVARAGERQGTPQWRDTTFISELVWREFAHHLLYHFPQTPTEPLERRFAHWPWRMSQQRLRAWQKGQTGIPIVDAGMRELYATGWMHNRVRMIVASLLVKNLQIHWLEGARWFWDTLLDADLAANTLNWQWVAGSGADAAPYFRIFNPVTQGRKFDAEGEYVRRWVPELAALRADDLHAPWQAPKELLAEAGVRIGETYPAPIVDLAESRAAALAAYRALRG